VGERKGCVFYPLLLWLLLVSNCSFLGFVYYGICGYWRGLSCILKNSYLVVTSLGLEEINPEISP
jgi:hypothetical protein